MSTILKNIIFKGTLFCTFIVLMCFYLSFVYSYDSNIISSGHMPLLTVSELANNTEYGGVADLSLVVKSGSGRIFIDSFPLSKIDTQITMRFATEIACDLLDKDCSNYDFFYTITANSAVVGGPSAGAAATVLTVALLDNQVLDIHTVMTGTINSGNLIGPVAGVPAKAQAAKDNGYTTILIPNWDNVNNTPDENLSMNIIYVSTLEEALYYFTGKNYSITMSDSIYDSSYYKEYTKIMSDVTIDLCTKYGHIDDATIVLPNLTNYGINITNSSQDNFISALTAMNNNSYYSAASFCFGGNVKIYNSLIQNLSNDDLKIIYLKLFDNVSSFKKEMDASIISIDTISELETYMIVAERLSDAQIILSEIDLENISAYNLAYASERFGTAIIWSRFSKLPGQEFIMDNELLRIACSQKISEAEERLNYLELYYPANSARKDLKLAYNYNNNQDYALCIFTASKIKADCDVVLSVLFVPEENIGRLYSEKSDAAKRTIAKQEKAKIFPILGYSYYEYSKSLENTEVYSSLLYAEYSLELSNLDMYFKKKEPLNIASTFKLSSQYIAGFISGLCIGIVLVLSGLLIFMFYYKKNYSSKKLKNSAFKSDTNIIKQKSKKR
jgi:uncharacterized protein